VDSASFVFQFLVNALSLFKWLLIAKILLSWFPAIDWYAKPWCFLNDITEPVMTPFRKLIPPLGGFDLSPLVLFMVLDLVIGLLARNI
jgi:YggT family protein